MPEGKPTPRLLSGMSLIRRRREPETRGAPSADGAFSLVSIKLELAASKEVSHGNIWKRRSMEGDLQTSNLALQLGPSELKLLKLLFRLNSRGFIRMVHRRSSIDLTNAP